MRSRRVRIFFAGFAPPLGAALATACGPGLEMMHESNLRFEHCYRLDMDPKFAAPHREHCWRDWTETYGTGQPLDRVEYARRRIVTLESGDTRLVTIHEGAPRPARVFSEISAEERAPMVAPAPTSAHAPPPKTEPLQKVTPPREPDRDGEKPGQSCSSLCETRLAECSGPCLTERPECAACRQDYRACMRRCFE